MRTVRAAALTLSLALGLTVATSSSSAFAADATPALTSSGTGTAEQQTTLPDGSRLVDPSGALTDDLEVAGVGSYQLGDGTLTFRPALGFTGTYGVLYQVTDASGATSEGTYTPSVTPPPPPAAPALTATGPYGHGEQCLIAVPEQGRLVLLDDAGQPTLDVTGAGGDFDADVPGTIAFSPRDGFTGAAATGYLLTDAYGQSASGSCTVTVAQPVGDPGPAVAAAPLTSQPAQTEQVAAPPTAPVATHARTRGPARRQQVTHLAVAAGSSVTLVDHGVETLHVYRAGQGSYALDPASLTITYTPSAGFHGTGSVTFRVSDRYGRSAQNVYTPTVLVAPRQRVVHPAGHLVEALAVVPVDRPRGRPAAAVVRHHAPAVLPATPTSQAGAARTVATHAVSRVVASVSRPVPSLPALPAGDAAVQVPAHQDGSGSALAGAALVVANLAVGSAAIALNLRRAPAYPVSSANTSSPTTW